MADNWSTPLTLTNAGDWAKWSMDIPDDASRDGLNDIATGIYALRAAFSGPDLEAILGVSINDKVFLLGSGPRPTATSPSSSGWISADRFGAVAFGNGSAAFFAVEFPALLLFDVSIVDGTPFVTGTNTIRLLHFGRASDLGAEPVEVDFLQFGLGIGGDISPSSIGDDTHVETKPAAFDPHVNPDPWPPHAGSLWLLKAPEASTGSAAQSLIEVEKYCFAVGGTINAKVRLTGSGSPISGTVWAYDHNFQTSQSASVDGNGEATFVMDPDGDSTFFYGGSDDWAPSMVTVLEDDRIGCRSGWYLGQIAMAS